MNTSVDDLVSSLSGSHIGQEAMDLAALQSQLTQILFCQTIPSSPSKCHRTSRRPSQTRLSNTPICHTPSSSFSYVQNQNHFSTLDEKFCRKEDVGEDERMVEELLIPSSPMTPIHTSPHFTFPHSAGSLSSQASTTNTPTLQESSFTSTDPFYIAQSQALQSYYSTGAPSQHSSFLVHQAPQRADSHGLNHLTSSVISLENNPLFMTASAAYGR